MADDGVIVCLLGLGEAGASIASDLIALGVRVTGWDPDPSRRPQGVVMPGGSTEAVAGSDVVLSVNSARAAVSAARGAAPVLQAKQLYADLNSGSPLLKDAVAEVVTPTGALFVDGALMDGVPGRGVRTRCLVSGPGADSFAALFQSFGMPVESVGPEPGAAASRKLLRSIFTKGLAAAAEEAVRAGEAAGCEAWIRTEISHMLASADESQLDRLLEGSRRHASRRLHEMEDVSNLLRDLGVEPRITASAIAYLQEMAEDELSLGSNRDGP